MVIEALVDYPIEIVVQADPRGTGHAMQMVMEFIGNYDGSCLVIPGDVPFLLPKTMRELVQFHEVEDLAATIWTAEVADPAGYGRIVRGPNGDVERIVEDSDASPDELSIREINSGVYVFDYRRLAQVLGQLRTNNSQGELYLTDSIAALRATGGRVGARRADDTVEAMGVNDAVQLREAERIYRERQPPTPPEPPRPHIREDEEEELELEPEDAGKLDGGAEAVADHDDLDPEEDATHEIEEPDDLDAEPAGEESSASEPAPTGFETGRGDP
jgi:bifunctional UDP-N-acetylglucosamine pyrophosphorylase/glucosamine-1-phosphate N-acetyltransferase